MTRTDVQSEPCNETDYRDVISLVHQPRASLGHRARYEGHKGFVVALPWERINSRDRQDFRPFESDLEALIAALDEREGETYNHSRRVSDYAVALARAMGLGESEIVVLGRAALLHDIGKISVPDHILLKPGPLSRREWLQIQGHPEAGHRILQAIPSLAREAEIVLTHHERYDGAGYPLKLREVQIPLASRIIAIADSLDAMTSDRPYRGALSFPTAVEEIQRCSGTQFDPKVVRAFGMIPVRRWIGIRARSMKRGACRLAADQEQRRLLA